MLRDLDSRGFSGEEFRQAAAFALNDLARAAGLPDDACELLDRWRIADWSIRDDFMVEDTKTNDSKRIGSILWQLDPMRPIPRGRFPILATLTRVYLCRRPHEADRWIDMLLDHVERNESISTWRSFSMYLSDVRFGSDKNRVRQFLDRLIDRLPDVLKCHYGVQLVARIAALLSDESRKKAYAIVRDWHPTLGPQAFGELISLRHLVDSDDAWARKQVDLALMEPKNADDEWIQVGIAFAAAKLWREPRFRQRSTEILCALLPTPSEHVSEAIMTVFRPRDQQPLDEATLTLFRQIAAHSEFLVRTRVDDVFFEHLIGAISVDAELVCRVCDEAVRRRGAELRSPQFGFFMANAVLIDVSLRLQRSGPAFRVRGMNLFESLLDLGVAEAVRVTKYCDHRLAAGRSPEVLRRRRLRRPAR